MLLATYLVCPLSYMRHVKAACSFKTFLSAFSRNATIHNSGNTVIFLSCNFPEINHQSQYSFITQHINGLRGSLLLPHLSNFTFLSKYKSYSPLYSGLYFPPENRASKHCTACAINIMLLFTHTVDTEL